MRLAGADFAAHPIKRGNVAAGKIDNVDVVANTGSVGGVVVVAEHADASKLADCNLCDIRKQVIGDALRVFADQTAFVGADGVEVAKKNDVPFVVANVKVGQDLLKHALGLIRTGWLQLCFGHSSVMGTNSGSPYTVAELENTMFLHAMLASDIAQHQGACDVVPVILERFLHAFANGLEACEVNDDVDVVLVERFGHSVAIEDIGLDEAQAIVLNTSDGADAIKRDFALSC